MRLAALAQLLNPLQEHFPLRAIPKGTDTDIFERSISSNYSMVQTPGNPFLPVSSGQSLTAASNGDRLQDIQTSPVCDNVTNHEPDPDEFRMKCLLQLLECFTLQQPGDQLLEQPVSPKLLQRLRQFLAEQPPSDTRESFSKLLTAFQLLSPSHKPITIGQLNHLFMPEQHQLSPLLRLDRRQTGFHHTLIVSPQTREIYQLGKKYDPKGQHDLTLQLVAEHIQHQHCRDNAKNSPQCLATDMSEMDQRLKFRLGEGYEGNVALAQRLSDHRLVAVKSVRKDDRDYKISSTEYANHCRLKNILSADDQRYFVLAQDYIPTVNKTNSPCGYIIEPLICAPDDGYRIKQLHLQRSEWLGHDRQSLTIAQQWLKLGEVLERNNMCHPDLRPQNIINGKLIDFGALWFDGQGQLSHHSPHMFPPKAIARINPADIPSIDNDFLEHYEGDEFHGVTRFALGASIFALVTSSLPLHYQSGHSLYLPFSTGLQSYRHGFTDIEVPSYDTQTMRLYNEDELNLLKIAKAMMADQASDRMSSKQALEAVTDNLKYD